MGNKGKKKRVAICPPDNESVAKQLMEMAGVGGGLTDVDRARILREAKQNVKKIMGKLK